jgi:hypothetical protein
MQLVRRQNVIIQQVVDGTNAGTIAATSNFNANLKLNFVPDIVTIKLIVAKSAVAVPIVINSIYVSELNNYIGSFVDSSIVMPNMCFDLIGVPLDSWNFILRDAAGALNTLFTGQIAIHMEFLKYDPKSLR